MKKLLFISTLILLSFSCQKEKLKDKNFLPTLFLGDSLYDIQTAQKYNLDFIFVYGWTDLKDWKKICNENGLPYVEKIQDLL